MKRQSKQSRHDWLRAHGFTDQEPADGGLRRSTYRNSVNRDRRSDVAWSKYRTVRRLPARVTVE